MVKAIVGMEDDLRKWLHESKSGEFLPSGLLAVMAEIPRRNALAIASRMVYGGDYEMSAQAIGQWGAALSAGPSDDVGKYTRTCAQEWAASGSKDLVALPSYSKKDKPQMDVLSKALLASVRFDLALGSGPEGHSVQDRLDYLLSESTTRLLWDHKCPTSIEASLWLAVGANPNLIYKDSYGRSRGESLLSSTLADPRAWYLSSKLCQAGAVASPADLPRLRQSINAAMAEDERRPRYDIAQRIQAIDALLAGMGMDRESYRGKGGARFGDFALGALWTAANAQLAKELTRGGVRWEKTELAKLPKRAKAKISSNKPDEVIIEMIEVFAGPAGPGEFSPEWLDLAKAAAYSSRYHQAGPSGMDKAHQWGSAFCSWGARSGWTLGQMQSLGKEWPKLTETPGWAQSMERLELGVLLSSHEKPKTKSMSL